MTPSEVLASLRIAGWVSKRLPQGNTVRERIDEYRNPFPDGIKGCIKRDDVQWRFTAELNIEERSVSEITVRGRPTCPECRAELSKTRDDLLGSDSIGGPASPFTSSFNAGRRRTLSNRPFWDCVSCDFTVARTTGARSNVIPLARMHAERIVESVDESWSLPELVNGLDDVDGLSVWEAYADVVDDEEVSTECFH